MNAKAIHRRRAVNPIHAQALLEALESQGQMGRHLKAFFSVMYHAGFRSSEAVMLTADEVELPKREDERAGSI